MQPPRQPWARTSLKPHWRNLFTLQRSLVEVLRSTYPRNCALFEESMKVSMDKLCIILNKFRGGRKWNMQISGRVHSGASVQNGYPTVWSRYPQRRSRGRAPGGGSWAKPPEAGEVFVFKTLIFSTFSGSFFTKLLNINLISVFWFI